MINPVNWQMDRDGFIVPIEGPTYEEFLKSKAPVAMDRGYSGPVDLNPNLKPHARDIAAWMIRGGNRACFASYGLHKTSIQLQVCEALLKADQGRSALIVCPLGVRREFKLEADRRGFDEKPLYIANDIEHAEGLAAGYRIFMTNYDRVRDGQVDPKRFEIATLDEASVLRGYGTKTYQNFLQMFPNVPFKFVATATPSPNRLKELIHYAGFLGIMDTGQALTRFFKRDSTQAGNLTLHPHKVKEFWLWCATWAVFCQLPSDLGYSDEGYVLPEIEMICHRIPADHATAGADSWGQEKMFRDASAGLSAAAKEKRDSLGARVQECLRIIEADVPGVRHIIWHDLERERHALEAVIPDLETITGDQSVKTLEERERIVERFAAGEIMNFGTKASLSGSGSNFQICWSNIYLGINYKANDFMQSLHRTSRFGQTHKVVAHLIFTEAEDPVYFELMRKIRDHNTLHGTMSALIKEYGLNSAKIGVEMERAIDGGREEVVSQECVEVRGVTGTVLTAPLWTNVRSDNVREMRRMSDDSVDLIVTSWPFSDHYEYTTAYNDFGHNDGDKGFFEQMEFLTPEVMRTLKPGRMYCVHAKDRIVYGSVSGLGMYSVNRFSDKCADHLERHGFIFCGRITVTTDVVRENNQTYRLGYSENAKDGTKMGVGSPEYILLFRKLPTDRSNSYADEPVVKPKVLFENPLCVCGRSRFDHGSRETEDRDGLDFADVHGGATEYGCREYRPSGKMGEPCSNGEIMIAGSGYSRANWQFDAHSYWRSSGNRFMRPEEIAEMPMDALRAAWLRYSRSKVYDFGEHVNVAEEMERRGILPASFMCLDVANPGSEWVWDDIARMRTLNSEQSRKGLEFHTCPLQIDIVERLIKRFSQKGGLVLDPFGGLGTVAQQAVLMGRRGYSIELNEMSHRDAIAYCRAAESKISMPTLFDFTPELVGAE